MKTETMKPYNIRLSDEQRERTEKAAAKRGLTAAQIIRMALLEWLEKEES